MNFRVEMNNPYSKQHAETRRMDWYIPSAPNSCGILFIHGGGFRAGNKSQWRPPAEYFAAKGFLCASPTYRFIPDFLYPAQVEDVRLAMSEFRSRAEEFGAASKKIAAAGSSAGGYLAAMLANISDDDELGACPELGKKPAAAGTRPAAVILYCALLSFHREHGYPPEKKSGEEPLIKLLGIRESENPAKVKEASPLDRIDSGHPPALLLHGDADDLIPLRQSEMYAEKLEASGVSHQLEVLPGIGHGFGYGVETPAQKKSVTAIEKFLKNTFSL